MAQAVFEDHPLGEYLRDAGEIGDIMPGTSSGLATEIDPFVNTDAGNEVDLQRLPEWWSRFLVQLLDILHPVINIVRPATGPNPFVERFKYDIISSSLLASTLQAPHRRSVRSPPIPGKLSHSRTTSVETNPPPLPVVTSAQQETSYITPSVIIGAIAIFYFTGYTLLAFFSLAAVALLSHGLYVMHDSSKLDMTPCLTSLNDLVAASDAWGSVVQEAVANVEAEEESLLYGTAFSTASPTSSVRVALHSSLLTTQTQCDNVRQLFSALTSATELSQLSEMYAPTPQKATHSLTEATARPLSLSASQRRSRLSDPKYNKRSTWNGSYTSLADQVGPLPQVLRRRGRRRSDLTSVLGGTPIKQAKSAPVTPITSPSVSLSGKAYFDPGQSPPVSLDTHIEDSGSFGAAALALNRSRRVEAADVFGSLSAAAPASLTSFTISSSSRLSPLKNSRHPLSLSALQSALNNALASKRYACSHLLALRFSEDEDEGYWEDVRSVMDLLTTTFLDASSRLMQALEDHEKSKLRDQPLTPLSETDDSCQDIRRDSSSPFGRRISLDRSYATSFAPTPGPFARFAAHVTAISSAMEDAKENLETCVSALKNHASEDPVLFSRRQSGVPGRMENPHDLHDLHPGLQAYERLRRELGLALRECERGRERLLEILKPPATDAAAHDSDSEDVPGLAHDASDDSDKLGPHSLSDTEEDHIAMNHTDLSTFLNSKINDGGDELGRDDATEHLLLSASPQHLPPPLGLEQVFEAEAASEGGFTRERSKLTREDRIKLMKARRESVAAGQHHDSRLTPRESDSHREGIEKWGPGGEVVQELRDVIWKVSERRRKLADGMRWQSLDIKDLDTRVPAAAVTTCFDQQTSRSGVDMDDILNSTAPHNNQNTKARC